MILFIYYIVWLSFLKCISRLFIRKIRLEIKLFIIKHDRGCTLPHYFLNVDSAAAAASIVVVVVAAAASAAGKAVRPLNDLTPLP